MHYTDIKPDIRTLGNIVNFIRISTKPCSETSIPIESIFLKNPETYPIFFSCAINSITRFYSFRIFQKRFEFTTVAPRYDI